MSLLPVDVAPLQRLALAASLVGGTILLSASASAAAVQPCVPAAYAGTACPATPADPGDPGNPGDPGDPDSATPPGRILPFTGGEFVLITVVGVGAIVGGGGLVLAGRRRTPGSHGA